MMHKCTDYFVAQLSKAVLVEHSPLAAGRTCGQGWKRFLASVRQPKQGSEHCLDSAIPTLLIINCQLSIVCYICACGIALF